MKRFNWRRIGIYFLLFLLVEVLVITIAYFVTGYTLKESLVFGMLPLVPVSMFLRFLAPAPDIGDPLGLLKPEPEPTDEA